MFRVTIRNLRASKAGLALITVGVMLAVSFVVSAFVLGDGLRRSFADVSQEVTAGVDLEVRGVADLGDDPPLPAATVDAVEAVDGVADAVALVESAENAVRPIKADGTTIPTDGPPQLAFAWVDNPALSPFELVAGSPPQRHEFTMDVDSAAKHGFVIGEAYDVLVPGGRTRLTLSGTTSYGARNATLGAVLLQVAVDQASELFGIDGITSVAVQLEDGVAADQVQAAVAAAVPGAELLDHDEVVASTRDELTGEIDLVGNILLGFGGVALFVSAFIIYNTFAIVVGQRTRELALLRVAGADPKQVRRSVLVEALLVGVVASAAGIGGGIAVAKGIEALFGAMGVDLVDYPLILAPRTLLAAVVLGIGVTLLAARGPARRAATIPPIAALALGRDRQESRRHRALGAVVRLVLAVLAWPLGRLGMAGRLAGKSAGRNPRRTLTTAAALTIGLALVSGVLVVGQSVKATMGATFDRAAEADYYVTDDLDEVTFPPDLVARLRASEVVAAAAGFTPVEARVAGDVEPVVAVDLDALDAVLDVGVEAGAASRPAPNPVLVSTDAAARTGLAVGDTIAVEVEHGQPVTATVVGRFDDQAIVSEDYLLDTAVLTAAGTEPSPDWLAFTLFAGADTGTVDALLTELTHDFPNAVVETPAQFRARVQGVVDGVLTMVNVIISLAVVIALIGIANTLALSVLERTRELGLLRAVGMTRRQLRRMVRYEASLIAALGAVLGVGVGLGLGAAVVAVLPATLADGLTVPGVPIAAVVLAAAVAGLLAAWLPARRAGRLDVLAAIAS